MDFPHRFAAPTTAAAVNLGPVVQAFGDLRADNAQREDARIAREAATKAASSLPSRRWNDMVATLSNVCQDLEEVDLPPVWGAMAKNGAKLDRQTLQHHFEDRASHPDSLSDTAPICSPELAKDLGGLVFAPKHRDELLSGLSVFAVSHPDQESARRASELAGHFDSQMKGVSAGMSFSDSTALKSAKELKLPTIPTRLLQLQDIYA